MLVAEAAVALVSLCAVHGASALYVLAARSSLGAAAEWDSSAAGHVATVFDVVHGRVGEGSFLTARSATRYTGCPPVHDGSHGRGTSTRMRGQASLLLRPILDED